MKRNGYFYSDQLRKEIKGNFCVYCGDNSNNKEHFPPISLTNKGVILPCCKECNSIAGTL